MFIRIDTVTVVLALLLLCLIGTGRVGMVFAEEHEVGMVWQAGVARVDITPDEPVWLAGYAARNRPGDDTLHPIWAKALALKDAENNTAVLVTADILGFTQSLSSRIHDRVERAHGLPRAALILSASHTHSAPVIADSLRCMYTFDDTEEERVMAYANRFEEQVVALIGEALDAMAPAALFAGNGVARFAVNRRSNNERDLTSVTTPAGPSDHAVPTLAVRRDDGGLAAIVFGYACHATVLDGYAWSGDYPGFAQLALEEACSETTALFFAGCGADQNPLPRRSIARARQYGQTLAASVMQVLEDPMRALGATLSVAYEEVMLELEPAPDADMLRTRVETTGGYAQRCNQWMLEMVEGGEALPEVYPVPVQLWRLGDQALVAIGGEVTVEYAIGIKERLGQETFVMGYANDVMSYLPSEQILMEGGYEGQSSQLIYGMPNIWKPGLETKILETVVALYNGHK